MSTGARGRPPGSTWVPGCLGGCRFWAKRPPRAVTSTQVRQEIGYSGKRSIANVLAVLPALHHHSGLRPAVGLSPAADLSYKLSNRTTSAGADKWLDVQVFSTTAQCVAAVKAAGVPAAGPPCALSQGL